MEKTNQKFLVGLLSLLLLLILTGCIKAVGEPEFTYVEDGSDSMEIPDEKIITEVIDTSEGVQEDFETVEDENQGSESLFDKVVDLVTEDKNRIPATFENKVAFASQAPHGNWDLPYQETCEEASMVTVSKFFSGETLTADIMDQELLKVVEWEKNNLDTYTDTNVEEVVTIARDYFGLTVDVLTEVTEAKIKQELVAGNLIIAPFAGRELGNPNFTTPGPIYHMLVITGYDRNEFITNDVGTRKGENYKYKYDVLIAAMHDLPNYDDGSVFRPYDDTTLTDEAKAIKMLTGVKKMIVIKK
ncbi:hypothetical protein COT97_04415 [Candidatus Falkowbacteria bacterium CG10_big_fil_rev_8_21_14_0_10_39_11]|uniref:Peptidase C39-like domain-containing protein n=1 Tax=Candidatus Falkowbacteria bacterium CG10_big_fil_rev_8_21_14_0_10_39_11 TaxID=1974565 RepID=A0A2H0V679_9BACT|nr:MAG: hypothetical protein COT97_04415 [Candidatus Falkowbacteria bacterium CG10_big_fil_rev_8_21_14_0_10_39_11]